MTADAQKTPAPEQKTNDKELNFRQLEAKYERQLAAERTERERLSKELEERIKVQQTAQPTDEEDESEPYVDHKRLHKKLTSFEKKLEEKIERKAEEKARALMDMEKKDSWIRNNSDFYEIMQHAEKFAETNPELAETILKMPEGFERQKLVYSNIKALGIHKPPETKQASIQDKVDTNRRNAYYQPSNVSSAPYAAAGDFSPAGQKQAYAKLKELKERLRLG